MGSLISNKHILKTDHRVNVCNAQTRQGCGQTKFTSRVLDDWASPVPEHHQCGLRSYQMILRRANLRTARLELEPCVNVDLS